MVATARVSDFFSSEEQLEGWCNYMKLRLQNPQPEGPSVLRTIWTSIDMVFKPFITGPPRVPETTGQSQALEVMHAATLEHLALTGQWRAMADIDCIPVAEISPSSISGGVGLGFTYPSQEPTASPSSTPTVSNTLQPSPTIPSEDEVARLLSYLIGQIRPTIKEFAASDDPLHLGTYNPPATMPKEHADLMRRLKVPMTNGSANLLLHDLGRRDENDPRYRCIEALFNPVHDTVLYNSSMSGKTSTLVEASAKTTLSIYNTFSPGDFDLGSADCKNFLQNFETGHDYARAHQAMRLGPGHALYGKAPEHLSAMASRHFSHIVLAKVVHLRIFLEETQSLSSEERLRRWTLFQLRPPKDSFAQWATRLRPVCLEHAKLFLLAELEKIQKLFPQERLAFILDEAQCAASSYRADFVSSTNPKVKRSVLQETCRTIWSLQAYDG
ncbi:hypothetical protein FA95DRAFT_493021 [Auriscalpium vulgare]|uniref:Uncharacterized protein n=1 Tax=Auriscalpium vulgare TaxID=40419 RepID=A0ACB8S393_9AGAM|nr:hypothetical protein FA95DRAFT_493021 [Auriscalpium vulgare]